MARGTRQHERESSGAELIAVERQRQIEQEGFTLEHDRSHSNDALAWAAAVYAAPGRIFRVERAGLDGSQGDGGVQWWEPWPNQWRRRDNPHTYSLGLRIEDLTKAGALIAAELDRLLAIRREAEEAL